MSKETEKEAAKVAKTEKEADFIVRDPEVLRPRVLPLVIEPAGGVDENKPHNGWASKAQQTFANVLNGYAYKNPEKWKQKKNDVTVNGVVVKGLLTTLKEKASAPDPVEGNLSFKNKLMQ